MSNEAVRRALLTGALPTNQTPKANAADLRPTPRKGDTVNAKERRATKRRQERALLKTLRQLRIGDAVLMPDGEVCVLIEVIDERAARLSRPPGKPTLTRLASLDTPCERIATDHYDDHDEDEEAEPVEETATETIETTQHTTGDTMTTTTTKKKTSTTRAKWTKQDDLDLLLNTKALLARGFKGAELWRSVGRRLDRSESGVSHRVLRLLGSTKPQSINAEIDAGISILREDLDLSTLPKQAEKILEESTTAEPTIAEGEPEDARRHSFGYTRQEEIAILRTALELIERIGSGRGVWQKMALRHGRTAEALRRKVRVMCGSTELDDISRTLAQYERLPNQLPFHLDDVPGPESHSQAAEPETPPQSRVNGHASPETVSAPAAPAIDLQVSTESQRVALLRDASAAGPEALQAIAAALVAATMVGQ